MRQLDLFAGIGGISLAAEWAGIETVAFCEKEPFAQGILRRRFPGRPIYNDVFNLTREVLKNDGITGIDIVAGGFPCQPFSHAGKRGGTADDRYLWPEMCRIVGELRPTWVFAENVDGLVSMAQSGGGIVMEDEATICEEAEMVIETIRKDLEAIGYRSIPVVIPACGVGASHRRYRIFILGYAKHHGLHGTALGRGVDPPGNNNAKGSDEACQSAGAGRRENSETMANPEGRRCAETRELRSGRSTEWASGSGEVVADTESVRLEGQRTCGQRLSSEYGEKVIPLRSSGNGTERAAQSRMGRDAYELPDWLDGFGMNPLDALYSFISSYPQPALMGQEQYTWEPPRVTTGVKNRAARLKALGNAVDPLQALPVLYGIRVIHEFLMKGGCLHEHV